MKVTQSRARLLAIGSMVVASLATWAGCGSDSEPSSSTETDAGLDVRSDSTTPAQDATASDAGAKDSAATDSSTTDSSTTDSSATDASQDAPSDGGADADADAGPALELFGTVNTSLVKIDTTTGTATLVGATNLGSVAKLAYHAGNGKLYGVLDYLTAPKLVTVDACSGQTQLVAALTREAGTVHFVGAIDYNPSDGKLYASASLDTAYPADAIEESLVSIDVATGVVSPVGTMREGVAIVDGDNLAFSPLTKLVIDVDPDDGGSHTLWDLNMTDAAATDARTAANTLSWIEFHKGKFYGTVYSGALARSLVTVDPATGGLTVVGPTHGPSDFGGAQILAISEGLCVAQNDN